MNSSIYYVVNIKSGLVIKTVSYASAINYSLECGGVVLNGRSDFAQFIVSLCRLKWNN